MDTEEKSYSVGGGGGIVARVVGGANIVPGARIENMSRKCQVTQLKA